jgi:PPIC-type peptidyl-prolyl cis-trans isomerase-like protein
MQRSTAALLGLGFVAALLGVILISHDGPKKHAHPSHAKPMASAVASAGPAASAHSAPDLDAGPDLDAAIAVPFTEGFETFPDGSKVPELPDSAPAEVSFGVVQFAYQGAQFSASDSRSKEQAKQKAEATLDLAKHDFAAAVSKGDRGSTSDAGRIPRGVLEPPIEYVLFMLDKGTVSPTIVDTPRGYWILRRNN